MAKKFSEELFTNILNKLGSSDLSIVYVCNQNDIHVSTFYDWINKKADLAERYTRAREQQASYLADQILEIADDGTNDYMKIVKGDMEYNVEDKEVTSRSKLRVEARKWLAAKLAPKKFGDKVDVKTEISGEIGIKQITGMEIK